MTSEQIFREFVARVTVAKNSCVVEASSEFSDDGVRVIFAIEKLRFDQGLRSLKHRSIRHGIRLRVILVLEMHLGFEDQPFGIGKIELRDGNDFARAFSNTHIADGEFARIAPIGIERAILFVSGNFHEWFDHGAAFQFSNTFDEILKALGSLAFTNVPAGDGFDDTGNVF